MVSPKNGDTRGGPPPFPLATPLSRMRQERLLKQALFAKANGKRPVGRSKPRWTNYIQDLGWNRLGLHPSEMMDVKEDHEVWRLNRKLLPLQGRNPQGKACNEKRRRSMHKRDISLSNITPPLHIPTFFSTLVVITYKAFFFLS